MCKVMKNEAYCCWVLIKKPCKTRYPVLPLGQELGALCWVLGHPWGLHTQSRPGSTFPSAHGCSSSQRAMGKVCKGKYSLSFYTEGIHHPLPLVMSECLDTTRQYLYGEKPEFELTDIYQFSRWTVSLAIG